MSNKSTTMYEDGFKNGWLQMYLEHEPSMIAIHSNIPQYSAGYIDGMNAFLTGRTYTECFGY